MPITRLLALAAMALVAAVATASSSTARLSVPRVGFTWTPLGSTDGSVTWGAEVHDPSATAAIGITVQAKFVSASGKTIATDSATITFIPAGEARLGRSCPDAV